MKSSAHILLCLSMIAGTAAAQRQALSPHSEYEPLAARAASSLAGSSAGVPAALLTTGEKSDWKKTGVYAETISIMRTLEKQSPYVKVIQFGTTSEGRAMYAMAVSADRPFTPALPAKTAKQFI